MIKKWLNWAADRGFGLLSAMLMRRAVAPLLRINEHALHESGLSRRAVADFLATPLGTEPGEFFPRHKQAGAGAPAPGLDGQPDARAGPDRRGRRRRRTTSLKSTLDLAKEKPMTRIFALLYGLASYLIFFVTILYAIGFVDGLLVPKDINAGPAAPWPEAVAVNLALMSLFAIQHSVMARKSFKQWWTRYVSPSIERSTYVLLASLVLLLLFWQWRPMPGAIWQIDHPQIAMAMTALSMFGWLIVFTSTFLINHFELFGLKQVADSFAGRDPAAPKFRTPLYYNFVRHPIYLGFIIAFWATPLMTKGHLLFASVTTAYIFLGIFLEERDLVGVFGDEYRRYRNRVAMILPWRRSVATAQPVFGRADRPAGGMQTR